MSDGVLLEIARQIPVAVILFGVIVMFLRHLERSEDKRLAHDKEMESLRIAAAKEREAERRAYDATTNNMWAVSIRGIVESQEKTAAAIAERLEQSTNSFVEALNVHERNSQERYKGMGITQGLLEAAKEGMRTKR
jgi:hypothetical protein